jgi:hypothetical protein
MCHEFDGAAEYFFNSLEGRIVGFHGFSVFSLHVAVPLFRDIVCKQTYKA